MRLTIEIDVDNAAFEDAPDAEVSRILQQLAGAVGFLRLLAKARPDGADEGKLRDVNGNTCGGWRVEGS